MNIYILNKLIKMDVETHPQEYIEYPREPALHVLKFDFGIPSVCLFRVKLLTPQTCDKPYRED